MSRKSNCKIILFTILLCLALLFFGCSPQKRLNRKVQRVERFAKKHDLKIIDTVTVVELDTFIVESVRFDTVNGFVFNDTTIVINNEYATVKYYYDSVTNNIYHELFEKPDTIIKRDTVKVAVDKIKYVENKQNLFRAVLRAVRWVALVLILLYVIKRFKTRL